MGDINTHQCNNPECEIPVELHNALGTYTNKDDWKAELSGIPAEVWGYVTREPTVAAGLTPTQEAKLDEIIVEHKKTRNVVLTRR